ncbi:hypothetical protein ACHAPM_001344 [Fusarium culmorum]
MDEEALAEFLYVFDLVRQDVAHLGRPKRKYTNVNVRKSDQWNEPDVAVPGPRFIKAHPLDNAGPKLTAGYLQDKMSKTYMESWASEPDYRTT